MVTATWVLLLAETFVFFGVIRPLAPNIHESMFSSVLKVGAIVGLLLVWGVAMFFMRTAYVRRAHASLVGSRLSSNSGHSPNAEILLVRITAVGPSTGVDDGSDFTPNKKRTPIAPSCEHPNCCVQIPLALYIIPMNPNFLVVIFRFSAAARNSSRGSRTTEIGAGFTRLQWTASIAGFARSYLPSP